MTSATFLVQALIFLGAAVLMVPLFKWLRLGAVMGYLVAGIVIGPFGFHWIQSSSDVMHFAEFGVALLLFLIGIEIKPKRLWTLKRAIFGTGGLQVISVVIAIVGIGAACFHLPMAVLVLAGMGFAMSSTAIAVQLLQERHLLKLPVGDVSFSVLLFQDLAVIPMLILIQVFFGGKVNSFSFLAVGKAVVAILSIIIIGKYGSQAAFRIMAKTHLREIFTAFALLLILSTAVLMQYVGLSPAFGTFLAGLLLADSDYRHELEATIEPFKGLLLGLFFISVGMSVNLLVLLQSPGKVLGLVGAIVCLKAGLLYAVARVFKLSKRDSWLFAILLSQGGEFGFVLFGVGLHLGMLSLPTYQILILSVALSMATTSLLMMIDDQWILPRFRHKKITTPSEQEKIEAHGIILAGFGRVGQIVSRILTRAGKPATILEQDPNQIDLVRRFGFQAFYGDVSRLDLLEAAGAKNADLLILAIDDREAAIKTCEIVTQHFPGLKVLVRVSTRTDAMLFESEGHRTFRETFGSAVELGETALVSIGFSPYEAKKLTHDFRRHDETLLNDSVAHRHDEKKLISMAHRSRAELARLLENEEAEMKKNLNEGWG